MLSPQKVTQHLLSFSCGVLRDVPKSPTRRENDCTTKITLSVFEGGLHSTSECLCPLEIAGIGNHRWQTRLLQEVLILCDVVSSSVRNLCSAQYFIITLCQEKAPLAENGYDVERFSHFGKMNESKPTVSIRNSLSFLDGIAENVIEILQITLFYSNLNPLIFILNGWQWRKLPS